MSLKNLFLGFNFNFSSKPMLYPKLVFHTKIYPANLEALSSDHYSTRQALLKRSKTLG